MKINKSNIAVTAVRKTQYPEDNLGEFLLVGKSNVGKSSFINTISSRKALAYTSNKPGKTQTINFYLLNEAFYLVDVPGYGYANVNKEKQKKFGLMVEEYVSTRENLRRVFLLVDFRHKVSENDLLMYEYLKYYNLGVTIIASKTDKVKNSQKEKQLKALREDFDLVDGDDIILFSSITKEGKDEVLNKLEELL